VDVLPQRVRDRRVRTQVLQGFRRQVRQERAAVEQQRVTHQALGADGDLRRPVPPAVQDRGDLAGGVSDAGVAEDLPGHGGAADVAEQVQLGEPEQAGQGDGVGPGRGVRPSRVTALERLAARPQDLSPGPGVPRPEARATSGAATEHQRDGAGRRAAPEIVVLRNLKAVPGRGEREDQPAQRGPVAVTGIAPAVRPAAQFPAQGLKRALLGRRQRGRTVIAGRLK
jgi:hypothetical protein